MILGILLIVSGTFFFLKITQVKVEGGDIYSDQQIIASAMSDKYAYHTLYFLAKSKLGSDETGKRGLDPGVGKGAHKSL